MYTRFAFNAVSSEKYEKAEKYFLKIRKMTNAQMGTNHNLGIVYMAMGQFEKAEECFLYELETFGDSFPRFKVLGDLFYAAGNRQKALLYYKYARDVAIFSELDVLLELRLSICSSEECFSEAQQAVDLRKSAIKLELQGDTENAINKYLAAAEKDPSDFQSLNNAGSCFMKTGETDNAFIYFKKAYAICPLPGIKENLARVKKV